MFLNKATAHTSTRCCRIGSPVKGKPMRNSTTTPPSVWAHWRNQAMPSPHRFPRFLLAWKYSPLPHHRQTIYPHWAGSMWKQCPPSSWWGLSARLRSTEGLSSCKQWGTWKGHFDIVLTSFCSFFLLKDLLSVSEDMRLVAQQCRSLHSDNHLSDLWPPHASLWGADDVADCFLPNLSTVISTVTFGCWNLGRLWADRHLSCKKLQGLGNPRPVQQLRPHGCSCQSLRGNNLGGITWLDLYWLLSNWGWKWESQWLKNFNLCSPHLLINLNHLKH